MNADGDRLYRDLRAALMPGADLHQTGAALSLVLAPMVAHDALRCGVMNPASGLGITSLAFWHGYAPEIGRALLSPDGLPDARELDRLAREPVPVNVADRRHLRGPCGRRLAEYGVGEELRLVLRDTRGVWGVLYLLREVGARPFGTGDVQRIAQVGPSLSAALRSYVTTGPAAPSAPAPPPSVLIVAADGRIGATTPQVRPWLEAMTTQQNVPDWLTESSFSALAAAAREHAQDPRRNHPRLCVPSVATGWWTTIEAQPLGDDGDVAIMIQRATGTLLLPSFCDWHAITTRERQIMRHLQDGSAPKQIARLLEVSVHTVNEHLRAIFRKTGTCGRNELVATFTA